MGPLDFLIGTCGTPPKPPMGPCRTPPASDDKVFVVLDSCVHERAISFNSSEDIRLPKIIEKCTEAVICFGLEGINTAMNKFNGSI